MRGTIKLMEARQGAQSLMLITRERILQFGQMLEVAGRALGYQPLGPIAERHGAWELVLVTASQGPHEISLTVSVAPTGGEEPTLVDLYLTSPERNHGAATSMIRSKFQVATGDLDSSAPLAKSRKLFVV